MANHFRVSEQLAISQLREGLETGKLSTTASPLQLRSSKSDSQLGRIAKELHFHLDSRLISNVSTLRASARRQPYHLSGGGFSHSPKFQSSAAIVFPSEEMTSKPSRPSMGKTKNRLKSNEPSRQPALKSSREHRILLGPSDLLRILSHVKAHPATIADTREALAISGAELKRLVRIGLLRESWGRGGVGVTIRLSQEGVRQLAWMNEASKLDQRAKRALFISLKQNFMPF